MTTRTQADRPGESASRTTVAQSHDRMIGAGMTRRRLTLPSGAGVHLVEAGTGPPVLHLHGSTTCCLSHLPLLERLDRVRSVAPDRPGLGLSDPVPAARSEFRAAAVRFVDQVLDALAVRSAALVGCSMGGSWATWYALARPDRVDRLVLLGAVPGLPGTSPPWLLRAMTTPVVGDLLTRHLPPRRQDVLRLMTVMGEGSTLPRHPDLLDSLVAAGRDRAVATANLTELRAVLGWGGFRRRTSISADELRRLRAATLVVWGDRDPVGSAAVAEQVAELIPDARLELLPAGHVPWLGHPDRVAELVSDFVLTGS
ncbi:alpha/beta hydrolase [Nocardioides sp.]|uniref:alpha/beta fold hydrolase n=1 Tax=Nocardioides sp. TaxID=35761 RepID=UPI002ED5F5D2